MSLNHIQSIWRLKSFGYVVELLEIEGKPSWYVYSDSKGFVAKYIKPEYLVNMCKRLIKQEEVDKKRVDITTPWEVGLHTIPM